MLFKLSLGTAALVTFMVSHVIAKEDGWVFDFTNEDTYTFKPAGGVIKATKVNFSKIPGTGMSMSVLNLAPCAMLPLHWHPHATNFVVAVHGVTRTWMLSDNTADPVTTQLTPGQMTIMPKGAFHFMQNVGCVNAQLISALDGEWPGTINAANSLFKFPYDQMLSIFGVADNENFTAGIQPVGTGAQHGNKQCLDMCNGVSASSHSASPFNDADASKHVYEWLGNTQSG